MSRPTFKKEDCIFEMPVNQGDSTKPFRVGIQNGQVDLRDPDSELKSKLVRAIHVPTGLTASESRFAPYRNKVVALAALKSLVELWILETFGPETP